MAAFCTVGDLASFLQVTIPAGSAAATRAITEASAAIQDYCHQVLEAVDDDEVAFDVEGRGRKLFLPELPVTAVDEVVEHEVTLSAGSDYQLGNHGMLHRIGAFWASGVQAVTVTYSHGYATLPEMVVAVCTRAAARAYQAGLRSAEAGGVAGVQALGLGDYSVTYGSEGAAGGGGSLGASAAPLLLPSEKRALERYRVVGA